MKPTLLSVLLFACLYGPVAKANTFDVYCVPSLDGVSTCSGWQRDQELQCVSSPGGVASCSSSGGAKFTCTQDASGLTTCEDNEVVPDRSQQNCTAIGDGSFSCRDELSTGAKQQDPGGELNAVSDIIGDETSSPIDSDILEQLNLINQPDIIDLPLLIP